MKDYPTPIDSYEHTRNAALRKVKDAASEGKNAVLAELARQEDPAAKAKRNANGQAMHMVCDKAIEMYREGNCTFKECISQLTDALKKL